MNEMESLNLDGLELILKRFVIKPSSIKLFKQFKVDDTKEFQLVEIKEGEEEIFPCFNSSTKMHTIDYFLEKLKNINIDKNKTSMDLLSKQ